MHYCLQGQPIRFLWKMRCFGITIPFHPPDDGSSLIGSLLQSLIKCRRSSWVRWFFRWRIAVFACRRRSIMFIELLALSVAPPLHRIRQGRYSRLHNSVNTEILFSAITCAFSQSVHLILRLFLSLFGTTFGIHSCKNIFTCKCAKIKLKYLF